MGLGDIANRLKADRDKEIGHRLFRFAADRGAREKPFMQPGDTFRASSLPYLCPREEVLAWKYELIRLRHPSPMLQITFDIGHEFHRLYRDVYLGPMGEWQGAWECLNCGWDTDSAGLSEPVVFGKGAVLNPGKITRMPLQCPNCGIFHDRKK